MSSGDPWGDSDPEDIFQLKGAKTKPTIPYEIKKEELEDPYRILKVELSSLINTNIHPMSVYEICQGYSELFCEELRTKAMKFGLTVTELFDVISDTVTRLKGPDGEILYAAMRSEKSKDIRAQIVQQNRGPKRETRKKWTAYGSRTRPGMASRQTVPATSAYNNSNAVRKCESIPLSSLVGGPQSDHRCGIIVQMIRDNGIFHPRSERIRIRIPKLQRIYGEMLNKLPLWGSSKTEKQYAESMGSEQYAKFWQISSEKNLHPTSPDDELIYFISVAPVEQDSSSVQPEFALVRLPNSVPPGRPILSSAAHNLIRNSLPFANTSQLPCDRLPETRADLKSRQRSSTSVGKENDTYERGSFGQIVNVTEGVADAQPKNNHVSSGPGSGLYVSPPDLHIMNSNTSSSGSPTSISLPNSVVKPLSAMNGFQHTVFGHAQAISGNSVKGAENIAINNLLVHFADGANGIRYQNLPKDAQHLVNVNPDQFRVTANSIDGGASVHLTGKLHVPSLTMDCSRIRPALAMDLGWLNGSPCLVDNDSCNYISGTPLFFLPPTSVIFVLRNGNEESERVMAVHTMLQDYYTSNEWAVLKAQPGIPCVARCLEDEEEYSYVRAIIVASPNANSFTCVCMDVPAVVTIDATDIAPIPDCFSVKKLIPSLVVGRIRNVDVIATDAQKEMSGLVAKYKNLDGEVAKAVSAAVFGSMGDEIIVDWVEPIFREWISIILLEQKKARPSRAELPGPQSDDALEWVKMMEANGEFNFAGLKFINDDDARVANKPVAVQNPCDTDRLGIKDSEAGSSEVSSSSHDEKDPIEIDIINLSEKIKQTAIKDLGQAKADMAERHAGANNFGDPAYFLKMFARICETNKNEFHRIFISSSYAFASCAKLAQPNENWDAVTAEIRHHL